MARNSMFSVSRSGFKYGSVNFAVRRDRTASVKEITHDGDTLSVNSPANIGTRFLGIDSPEISFDIPGSRGFLGLDNEDWIEFFESGDFESKLKNFSDPHADHLRSVIGDGKDVALNHRRHAEAARQFLIDEIDNDMTASGKTKDDFRFFLAYGFEFLDSYGRLLCYIRPHRDNFEGDVPASADIDYNIRQLAGGFATPYFIFPNVDPFLRIFNPLDERIIQPEGFWKIMNNAGKLQAARAAVKNAREKKRGVYNETDPLRLLPMELRTLARGSKPSRYVIDLGQPGTDTLLDPELYFTIKNVEDRMYIPGNFGEYFQLAGWKLLRAETYERFALPQ